MGLFGKKGEKPQNIAYGKVGDDIEEEAALEEKRQKLIEGDRVI